MEGKVFQAVVVIPSGPPPPRHGSIGGSSLSPQTISPQTPASPHPLLGREKSVGSPVTVPDGGLTAWYQVLGSFFLFFNTWGIINSFGVFQSYYGAQLAAEASASDISWIGSIQGALLFSIGIITGPLFDWGHMRALLLVGSVLVVAGMMITSVCTHYWQAILAQGLLIGLGSGCLFVPSIAVLPQYFKQKKGLAVGVAASGSSLGGIIFSIIFRQLQPKIGFGWTVRVMAFIMLATLAIPVAGLKVRSKPASRRRMIDLAAWKEAPYTLFNLGFILGLMGIYVPFFYIQSYALAHLGEDPISFYLLVILNASSFFGRILPNFVADKIGVFNMLIPTSVISAVLAYAWIDITTPAGLIAFAIFYGFFSGTFLSLPPTAVVTLSPSVDVVGVRLGMNMFVASFGLLIGNPIAGAILQSGWAGLQAYGATTVVLAAVLMTAARVAKVGWGLNRKF